MFKILMSIASIFSFFSQMLDFFKQKDIKKEQEIKELKDEVKEALESNDPSKITAAFDNINN